MNRLQDSYSHEFCVFKPDKKLKWLPHLGTVELELELDIPHFCVLTAVDDDNVYLAISFGKPAIFNTLSTCICSISQYLLTISLTPL